MRVWRRRRHRWGFGRGIRSPAREGLGRYCAPAPDFLKKFLLNDTFCLHSEAFIRQLTRPVTIMLKPAQTSDVVAKSCNVLAVLQEINLDRGPI